MENMSKNRINYLTGMANFYGIEYTRVRAMALALGESKDKNELLEELEIIKHNEKINRMRGFNNA